MAAKRNARIDAHVRFNGIIADNIMMRFGKHKSNFVRRAGKRLQGRSLQTNGYEKGQHNFSNRGSCYRLGAKTTQKA